MATLLDKLRRIFSPKAPQTGTTAVPAHTPFTQAAITQLMRQVEATQEGLYTCDETAALLDEYVELVVSRQDAASLMPLVEAHLRLCPECALEYDILVTILETEEP